MSHNEVEHQQAKDLNQATPPIHAEPPAAPNQNNNRPKPEAWWPRLKHHVGRMGCLIAILVVLVAAAFYLIPREVPVNQANRPVRLIVLQLNDIYRLDAVRHGKRGGLGRVVTLLRQLKMQNPDVPVIVLHAGDFLAPSLESNLFHGAQMVDAMNFINEVAPLYVVPGNHEFDYSDAEKAYLTDAIAKSSFTWLASNLERNDPRTLPALNEKVPENVIVLFGKRKLGVFGLTIDASHRGDDQPYASISGDYARVAATQIQQLERAGAELIVGLTHLNIGDDHELAKLKQTYPHFVWIAGGHEHSLDREPASSGTALITKGDSNARTVWKISVVENGQNLEIREESIAIDESIEADAAYTHTIEAIYRAKLRKERPYLDYEISTVSATQPDRCFDGTEEAVRDRESDWGDLLADTMRTAYKGMTTDIAVLNGGSIRIDDYICDRISFEDLERTFAYETPVVLIKLRGRDLKQHILDYSASSKTGDGRFLQVSGIRFRRNSSTRVIEDLQVESGNRVVPFDDSRTYIVAINKYLFDCGDGYQFRQFVTEYIPAGPDLRTLTYAQLSSRTNPQSQRVARINDLPSYAGKFSRSQGKWQTLSPTDRQCPK